LLSYILFEFLACRIVFWFFLCSLLNMNAYNFRLAILYKLKELDGPAVSALQRAIAIVKQRWSVIGWVTKNLLFWVPPCFGRHVKTLVHLLPLAPTNLHWAHVVGYGPFSLCVHKEDLCQCGSTEEIWADDDNEFYLSIKMLFIATMGFNRFIIRYIIISCSLTKIYV
jgi:hypothetical protein